MVLKILPNNMDLEPVFFYHNILPGSLSKVHAKALPLRYCSFSFYSVALLSSTYTFIYVFCICIFTNIHMYACKNIFWYFICFIYISELLYGSCSVTLPKLILCFSSIHVAISITRSALWQLHSIPWYTSTIHLPYIDFFYYRHLFYLQKSI